MVRLLDMETEQLKALAQYRDVLETGGSFKRNFWGSEKETSGTSLNCQVITRYCLEYIENITYDMLPSYNMKQLKEIFINNGLSGMLQIVFTNDIVAVLKNAYPNQFDKRELTEWMWSKHGIWENDDYVIEAVQYMVLKEGIRRVESIPKYDWKKRLLKYGIYNVLSRFDWSIYRLFDFVYPGRFHPSEFRYRTKWKTSSMRESYENAYHLMDKTFPENQLSSHDILMLNSTGFKRLGLISMLHNLFDGNSTKAKEFYFYRTISNAENKKKLKVRIQKARTQKENDTIRKRLSAVSTGKYLYNLHAHSGTYSYLNRCAVKRDVSIAELVGQFGYVYKSARTEYKKILPEQVWDLRKKGLTYVEIANKLGSNPASISNMCKKHFGGDPLIPRPIDDYITIQELMDTYHVDHKTIMKLVTQSDFESHFTIRHRYLKKSEIIPAILEYKENSLQHQALLNRYEHNPTSTQSEKSELLIG
ncbi:MAG TPA: hypothetical protein VFD00_00325 [Thermoclostridium sp.]|nr:hypothetical protein [Thermoclostridium sp.]